MENKTLREKVQGEVSRWIIQEIAMPRIMTEVMLYSFTEPAAKIKEWWWEE